LNKVIVTVAVPVIGPIARSFEVLATTDTKMLAVWGAMLCSLVVTEQLSVRSVSHIVRVRAKGKSNVYPRTCHESPDGE
jgi:hypothetical protein